MEQVSQKFPMIVVEGNVGVGKSTFLNFLKKHLDAYLIYEPNQLWQDVEGHDLLEQFFLEPKRWAYTCQCYILTTRIDQFLKEEEHNNGAHVCVSERSVYSGRYVFAQVAKELGTMNGLEWCLYKKMWDREINRLVKKPQGFIYMRTPAEICLNRIMKRGRFEEQPISIDYLKRIEEKYENWFIHKQGVEEHLLSLPQLVLDFSEDFESNSTMQDQYLVMVKNFIEQLTK